MRPGTSELTRTSWFGRAATVPVIVSQEVISPRATLVTVTVATCSGVFPPASAAAPPVVGEQAEASPTAKAEAPQIIRDAIGLPESLGLGNGGGSLGTMMRVARLSGSPIASRIIWGASAL